MTSMRGQLELYGLEGALRRADAEGATSAERRRLRNRVEATHKILSELATPEERAMAEFG